MLWNRQTPQILQFCLFVCLCVWCFSSHSRVFHSYRDFTITGEGQQILTYAWHSWPLSSEGSLACHACCDTGAFVYYGHFPGPATLTPIAERLTVDLSQPFLTAQVYRRWDQNTQHSACGATAFTHCNFTVIISKLNHLTYY